MPYDVGMSEADGISYHFVQGDSLSEVEDRSRALLQGNGWESVGIPRAVQVRIPGRGVKVCFSQTFARKSNSSPQCARVTDRPWEPASPCDHFVQIYDTENSLIARLRSYVADAFEKDEVAIVIARPSCIELLEQRLGADGIDVKQIRARGLYISIDAAGLLKRFMVDGSPNERLFVEAIEGLLHSARVNGRKVRAFGEMVALLWSEGNRAAAMRLEELWHPLCQREQFPLFCAYPKSGFAAENFADISLVCAAHTRVF